MREREMMAKNNQTAFKIPFFCMNIYSKSSNLDIENYYYLFFFSDKRWLEFQGRVDFCREFAFYLRLKELSDVYIELH